VGRLRDSLAGIFAILGCKKETSVAGAAVIVTAILATHVAAQTPGASSGPSSPGDRPSEPRAPAAGESFGVDLSTSINSSFARDRNVGVTERPHEGYEAKGIRLGGFLAYPKVTAEARHSDNIYATETQKVGDTIWMVTPEIDLVSNWPRHAVNAYARAAFNRYTKATDENTSDYAVGVSGRADLLRFSNVTANVDWSRLTEPRTSPNSIGVAAKPVRYDLGVVGLRGQHEVNRLRLSGGYNLQHFTYSNPPRIGSGVVDQSFRDRDIHLLTGRVDYAVSPATSWFVEMDANSRNYKHVAVGDVGRNSAGVQALGGVNFEISALLRGELGLGYLRQTFDDSRLKAVKGFGARSKIEWFPTQLTTVTLEGARTVEDSAVAGSGAYVASHGELRVDHELLRNLLLAAKGGFGVDRYKDINRTDNRVSAGFSATYLLNRAFGLTGSYNFDKRKTVRGTGSNFKENQFLLTLTAQF